LWYRDLFRSEWGRFWIENYFSGGYRKYTVSEILFLKEVLNRGGITLDLCCGPGRHSIPLSFYGKIVSFDLSKYFLLYLKNRGKSEGCYENLHLVQGDMRRLPFKSESFDNVINFHMSFGYFSDEENELVLREVSRILKSNGVFVLDIANPRWIIRNFQERVWDETNSFYVLEKRNLDLRYKRLRSHWVLIDKHKGKLDDLLVDHRLYDLKELEALITGIGLNIVDVFGSPKKEMFYKTRSRRILIITRKKL